MNRVDIRKKKITVLFALLLSVLVVFGACAPTPNEPSPAPAPVQPAATPTTPATAPTELGTTGGMQSSRDIINIQLSTDPGNLSPFGPTHADARRVRRQIFEPLIDVGYDRQPVGVLAESWEADGDNWLLHLRQGVKFHDGSEFTASDALFSIRRGREESSTRRFVDYIDIENSKAIDDYTLLLVMEEPFLFVLPALHNLLIVSEAAYTADPDTPIGTGAYKFDNWVLGSTVTLQRFEDYWGGPAPIQTAVFRVIPESAQRVIELEIGGVDLLMDMPEIDFGRLDADPRFEVLNFIAFRSVGFFFNLSGYSISDNHDLRVAIAYSIEKEGINNAIFNGLARPAVTVVTEQYVDFNPEWKTFADNYYQFDLDKAREAFARSGVAEGTTMNLMTNDNPRWINMAEILQAQLSQIGINIVISTYENAVFEDNLRNPNHGWDMAIRDMNSPSGHILSKTGAFFAATGSNRSFYQGEEFNSFINAAQFEQDPARVRYYSDKAAQIIMEDLPAYFIAQMAEFYAWNSELQNFNIWALNNVLVHHLYFR